MKESISRRELLRTGACLLTCPVLAACGSASTEPVRPLEFADEAASMRDGVVEIDVERVPQWRRSEVGESAVVFLAVGVIVVRRSSATFSAFSAVCPHAGCGVSVVRAGELVCPCHGSTFTYAGERIAGPAETGLTRLAATYDAAARRLTIRPVQGGSPFDPARP